MTTIDTNDTTTVEIKETFEMKKMQSDDGTWIGIESQFRLRVIEIRLRKEGIRLVGVLAATRPLLCRSLDR